jgi:hypothetical protein
MEGLVTGKDGGAHAIFDGFGEGAAAVVVVEDEQVIVAGSGRGNEAAV